MARIQLENRLGVALQRLLFTGRSYTVEPPPTIPPNAVVIWQTDDTGAVTFSMPLAVSGGSAPARPSADTVAASVTSPIDSGAASAVPASSPRSTAVQVASPAPTPAASADRRFTIGWQFSSTGHPTYRTQHVDEGLRVRLRERGDGASYVVSSRRRTKRAPLSPAPRPRRSRMISVAGLLAALLIITTAGAAAAEVYAKTGRLPFGLSGPPHTPTSNSSNATPRIVLTSSQTSVVVGTSVTLTASLEGPFHASGYHIDIVNAAATASALNPSPCPVSSSCTASVTSSAPAANTYVAYLERGLPSGAVASSNSVTVTWTPSTTHNGPTIVTLAARPAPDSDGIVRVKAGTTVTLTASTDRAVESAHYQITIVDSGSNSPVAPVCSKGTSCVGLVKSDSPISRTYVAQAVPSDPASSGGRLSSSAITVMWSATPPPPRPPSQPPTVHLSSNPAPSSGGTVNVTIGTAVTLTATASATVDNSNYYIQLNNDTTGTQVGNSCTHGTSCGATVQSASPATNVYKGYIVRSSPNQIVVISSPITVIWSLPPPPTGITLAVSDAYPNDGEQVTLTAATQGGAVTNTGYSIQLVDVTDGDVILCQTGSGTTCVVYQTNSEVTITYEAYVDQGDPHSPLRDSGPVTVQWSHTILFPRGFPRPIQNT